MQEIGKIQQVQIQLSSLKVGQRPNSHYDPAPILVVEKLLLTPDGVIGVKADGEKIVDIHNARHPDTRNNGDNSISIGFTAHYAAMRERFGLHLRDGIAGENIIIDAGDRSFSFDELGARVAIKCGGQLHLFNVVKIAAPCVEFSTFAAGKPIAGEAMQSTLQFLHNGRRGFHIATTDYDSAIVVQVGDTVFVGA
jgi:hypothetical protein